MALVVLLSSGSGVALGDAAFVPSCDGVYPVQTATGVAGAPISVHDPGCGPGSTGTVGAAVTPDGRTAYVVTTTGVTAVDVAAGSVDGVIAISGGGSALAITPDGKTVYVVSTDGGTLTSVDVATNQARTPIAVGHQPVAVAIAPDGKTAYVVEQESGSVVPIDLATGGQGQPIPVGSNPADIAITPDGKTAFVPDDDPPGSGSAMVTPIDLGTSTARAPIQIQAPCPNSVSIAPDGRTVWVATFCGQLVPIDVTTGTAGVPISFGTGVVVSGRGMAISPDGGYAYVSNACTGPSPCAGGEVRVFDVLTGTFTGYVQFPLHAGLVDSPRVAAFVPGPHAGFLAAAAKAGSSSRFDATASANPGGSVTSYAWDFGDGASAAGSNATIQHFYARAGTYVVTLTTTNSGGCATSFIFTGRSASCSGSATARTAHTISVPPTTPSLSSLTLTRRAFRAAPFGPSITSTRYGTTVSYRDNESARTTLTVLRTVPGVRRSGKCVASPRPPAKQRLRHCQRVASVGSFNHRDSVGVNRFVFTGRIAGHALKPGSYTLRAIAGLSGLTSNPVQTHFRIETRRG